MYSIYSQYDACFTNQFIIARVLELNRTYLAFKSFKSETATLRTEESVMGYRFCFRI